VIKKLDESGFIDEVYRTHECGVLIDFHHLLRPPLCSSIHSSVSRSSSSNCTCE
jgi:hypothetical protein